MNETQFTSEKAARYKTVMTFLLGGASVLALDFATDLFLLLFDPLNRAGWMEVAGSVALLTAMLLLGWICIVAVRTARHPHPLLFFLLIGLFMTGALL